MLFCQGTNHSSCYSLVAMVIYLCGHLTYDSRGAWHTVIIISEMLPEIRTMETCGFLTSTIYCFKYCDNKKLHFA